MPRQRRVPKEPTSINDRLRPYIPQHSLSIDLTEFANIGPAFVTEVARVFALRAGGVGKGTTQNYLYTLRLLLSWIQANSESFPAFRGKLLTDYKSILVDEWELVLNAWRDELVNGEHRRRETTRAHIIRKVNVLVETFVDARIVRPISRLAPIKYSGKKIIPKKYLAEVSQLPSLAPTKGPFPCGPGKSPLSDNPSLEVLNESIKGRTDDHIQDIARLNEKRLGNLRRCAELELRKWNEHFNEGQRLLKLCDMPFSEIRKTLHGRYKDDIARRRASMKLFPKRLPEVALARYLTYILHEHGGLIPNSHKSPFYWFHMDFCRSRGRVEKVRSYLIPSSEATNAVRVIFLIDTGANVAVCNSLNRDCLSDSDVPGHKTIAGFKDRARGKLIISELPIRDPLHEISCVHALQVYLEMSKWLAEGAPTNLKNKLFLHVSKRRGIEGISLSTTGRQFKKFLSRHRELQGLNLNADMIRPTILFQAMYQNDGNLVAANALGDHRSLSTTSIYANKPSLRLVYERLIREFQSLFQTVSVSDINGAPLKLGVKSSQFHKLLSRAHQTGLGVACLNPKAGYQPKTTRGKDCEALERCPNCPLRFVIATVPNISDLILFYWHLLKHQSEFEATRPQRWEQTWLPWLVFAEVALEKVQRGPSAEIYQRAKIMAESRVRTGTVNFPPLW